jgi:hypothetical protein
MLGLGLGVAALAPALRRHVPIACAIAMIVLGVVAIGVRARPMLGHADRVHTMESPGHGVRGQR